MMKLQRDRNRWLRNFVWLCSVNSWKFKLLVGFVMLLFTLLLASRAAFIVKQQQSQPDLLFSSPRNRYTVVINTWKRYDLLKKSVAHYASCNGVDAVRVVWSERESPSDALLAALFKAARGKRTKSSVGFRIDINERDDLNNRFKPLHEVATRGIFSVDDDLLVPCATLEFAFRVWMSAPDSVVGFVPRMHWTNTKKEMSHFITEQLTYSYGGWWSVWWTGTYSMVLTKAAFLHHKYFDYYTNEMPASIREFVARERNCEDIAMSFLVANLTSAPPIWVKGKLYEIGSSGISSLKGHSHHRSECLNSFAALYGYMPLVPSNVKALDANSEWGW